jgi:hypothetical protein
MLWQSNQGKIAPPRAYFPFSTSSKSSTSIFSSTGSFTGSFFSNSFATSSSLPYGPECKNNSPSFIFTDHSSTQGSDQNEMPYSPPSPTGSMYSLSHEEVIEDEEDLNKVMEDSLRHHGIMPPAARQISIPVPEPINGTPKKSSLFNFKKNRFSLPTINELKSSSKDKEFSLLLDRPPRGLRLPRAGRGK